MNLYILIIGNSFLVHESFLSKSIMKIEVKYKPT